MSVSIASPQREFSISRVLHIFQNDVRRLWPQIVATLALMVFVIWSAPDHWLPWDQRSAITKMVPPIVLLPVAWSLLVIRVIHGDKLVGDRQFWVTRPYGWKTLLAAKVLFIALAINLPMLISDAIVLSRAGFTPTEYALGLIWRQLLLTILLVLPSLALATLTGTQSRLEGLVFFGVGLLILLIFGEGSSASGLYALDWVRTCLELLVVALACIEILLWQYSRRERAIGYQLLAAGLALVGIVHIFMPWSALVSYEYLHSDASPGFSSFQLDYDPDPALYLHQKSSPGVPGSVRLQVPVRVSGLPEGYAVAGDAIKVSVETADHLSWHSRWENSGIITWSSSDNDHHGFVDFTVSDWLFERAKSDSVKLRLTLALTFLKEHPVTAVATEQPFRVPGVAICAVSGKMQNSSIFCRAPLRTPYQYSVKIDWTGSRCFSVSGNVESANDKIPPSGSWYSNMDPLPAEFAILPVVTFNLGSSSGEAMLGRSGYVSYYVCPGVQLTFGTHDAAARTQRELEINSIRLTDYQIESSQ